MAAGNDGTFIYGKWEDYSNNILPALDACGAHFGVTPDSNGASIYHHHVQDFAPVSRAPRRTTLVHVFPLILRAMITPCH